MRAAARLVEQRRQRSESQAHRLHGLNPEHVLRRGYAWLTDEADRAIVSVRGLESGSRVKAVLSDGMISATVNDRSPRDHAPVTPTD